MKVYPILCLSILSNPADNAQVFLESTLEAARRKAAKMGAKRAYAEETPEAVDQALRLLIKDGHFRHQAWSVQVLPPTDTPL